MSRLGRRQSHIGWHIGEWDVFINRNTEDIRPNGRLCRFNDQIEFAPSSASECVVRFFLFGSSCVYDYAYKSAKLLHERIRMEICIM